MKKIMLVTGAALALTTWSWAATVQYETVRDETWVEVEGDSTLHAWSARSTEPTAESKLAMDPAWWDATVAEGDTVDLKLTFHLPAASLTSGRRSLDRVMHDALLAGDYPEISYRLTAATVREVREDESRVLLLEGEYTCAGVTLPAETEVVIRRSGEQLVIEASRDMLMTDFEIDPPRAMLGAVRAADEVTVSVQWTLRPSEPEAP